MKNNVSEAFPPNHLAGEKSPYLLQHAHQPVDWYPWGDAAFEKARAEKKPLLLSIGYATCHWCHVMADESFADPDVAALMNRYFVCVKIDREERPDLDQIYITAVSALTGSAGWPLNVFVTPEGKPFFGGTYFPPTPRHGMPSWRDVIAAVGRAWENPSQRFSLNRSAADLTETLEKALAWRNSDQSPDAGSVTDLLSAAVDSFAGEYDAQNGGFSNAPKFPMPTILDFLLFYHRFRTLQNGLENSDDRALKMATHTLEKMAQGGVRDHIGGGFHRYSTDARWHVPHFEKMLYDNAQLSECYLKAYEMTGNHDFADVAIEILDYVLRDMRHKDGGFYSAEDADSPVTDFTAETPDAAGRKAEGAFYIWRQEEIETLLGPDLASIFASRYGIDKDGNAVSDMFGEFAGKNILFQKHSIAQLAEQFDRTPKEVSRLLKEARRVLFAAREKRPRPHLDDKILAEWNGLMISALATAYRLLGDKKYLLAARESAHFILQHLFDSDTGELYRRWRDGERRVPGMAADYAFMVQGLLDLYDAAFDAQMLICAMELAHAMIERFYDAANHGFYTTREGHDPYLLFKSKELADGVLPASPSVAALSTLRLYRLTGNHLFLNVSEDIVAGSLQRTQANPGAVPCLLVAAGSALLKAVNVVISGKRQSPEMIGMIASLRSYPADNVQVVLIGDDSEKRKLYPYLAETAEITIPDEGATAYVCVDHACRSPINDADALDRLLADIFDDG